MPRRIKPKPEPEVCGTAYLEKPPYQIPLMAEINAVEKNGYTAVSTFSGCGGSCLGYRWAGFDVRWASEFVPAAQEVYKANHPDSFMDKRDIRDVKPEEILEQLGMEKGEIDLLDGSPPCASFSLAGKRQKAWGKVKKYSEVEQRVDDLFFEYARILEGLQPRCFIAENVKGLVIGKAKGYFKLILQRLKDCGYDVRAQILNAQWLGVPQRRNRLIFFGVRQDLGVRPEFPKPLKYQYTLRDACPWIQKAIHDTSGNRSLGEFTNKVCPTITIGVNGLNSCHYKVCGPVEPESFFEGYAIEKEWKKLKPGKSSDKYMNLVRAHPDKPCPTVTQTAGLRGAAGVTHPFEKRKFTIRELRRVCGFPDDFVLLGKYTQQWERLGRAVPPPMARAIGLSVLEVLKKIDA